MTLCLSQLLPVAMSGRGKLEAVVIRFASGHRFRVDIDTHLADGLPELLNLSATAVMSWITLVVSSVSEMEVGASYDLFVRLEPSSGRGIMALGDAMKLFGQHFIDAAATAGVIEIIVILRLRGGKGGFGKQLVRTGRMYASAKRRLARSSTTQGGNKRGTPQVLSRNLQGEMNTDGVQTYDESKRHRIDRRVAAAADDAAQEEQRQIAKERLIRLEQETAVVIALQSAISSGLSALVRDISGTKSNARRPERQAKPESTSSK